MLLTFLLLNLTFPLRSHSAHARSPSKQSVIDCLSSNLLRFFRSSSTTTKGICPWKYRKCLTSFSADFCPKFHENSRPNSFAYLTLGYVQVDLTKLVLFVFRLLSFQMIEIGLVKTQGTRLRVSFRFIPVEI